MVSFHSLSGNHKFQHQENHKNLSISCIKVVFIACSEYKTLKERLNVPRYDREWLNLLPRFQNLKCDDKIKNGSKPSS